MMSFPFKMMTIAGADDSVSGSTRVSTKSGKLYTLLNKQMMNSPLLNKTGMMKIDLFATKGRGSSYHIMNENR